MKFTYVNTPVTVNIKASDQAVYIGTIKVDRNKSENVKAVKKRKSKAMKVRKITIVNDYSRAAAEFRKVFGDTLKVRKSLARKK